MRLRTAAEEDMHSVVSSGLKEAERHAMRGDNEGQKDVQRACRSMSLTHDRGLTTPSGRVHSLRDANRPGPCGVPLSLRQICSGSLSLASVPRPRRSCNDCSNLSHAPYGAVIESDNPSG